MDALRPRHVALAVGIAFVGPLVLGIALDLADIHMRRWVGPLVGDALPALVAIFLLTRLGWWRRAGWRAPVWRSMHLLWLPLVLLTLSMISGFSHHRDVDPGRIPGALLAVLVIGFTEETWFRGILVEALRSRGAPAAAVVSAAVFAAIHLVNVRALGLASTLAQMLGAFAIGLMFGAVRLRIESLVPLVLIHAAFDFPYLLGVAPKPRPITAEGVRVLGFLIAVSAVYALVVTRHSKTEDVSEVVPTLG